MATVWIYPGSMRSATDTYQPPTAQCAIERALGVVGERWSLLILREAHAGVTRFAHFRANLGIATNVLITRLGKLVAAGVFEKGEYQTPGDRARPEYHLTPAGRDLAVVLGALQQWGDTYLPLPKGPVTQRTDRVSGKPVAVSFINERGKPIESSQVDLEGPGAAGRGRR
jgi:DNA-binding HxlR family transcriptional regulator